MRFFLLFRGSQPGLFYDLSTGDTCAPSAFPSTGSGLRLPPLISREKDGGLPPVTVEKTSCPSRYCKLFDALSSSEGRPVNIDLQKVRWRRTHYNVGTLPGRNVER